MGNTNNAKFFRPHTQTSHSYRSSNSIRISSTDYFRFSITICFLSSLVQRKLKLAVLIRQCISGSRNIFTSRNSSLSRKIFVFLIFNNSSFQEHLFYIYRPAFSTTTPP